MFAEMSRKVLRRALRAMVGRGAASRRGVRPGVHRAVRRGPVPSAARRVSTERGMSTAEYAIGTVAAASFAAVLVKLLTSHEVQELLMQVLRSALSLGA